MQFDTLYLVCIAGYCLLAPSTNIAITSGTGSRLRGKYPPEARYILHLVLIFIIAEDGRRRFIRLLPRCHGSRRERRDIVRVFLSQLCEVLKYVWRHAVHFLQLISQHKVSRNGTESSQ